MFLYFNVYLSVMLDRNVGSSLMFLYFNVYLSVMLDRLSCSFTLMCI